MAGCGAPFLVFLSSGDSDHFPQFSAFSRSERYEPTFSTDGRSAAYTFPHCAFSTFSSNAFRSLSVKGRGWGVWRMLLLTPCLPGPNISSHFRSPFPTTLFFVVFFGVVLAVYAMGREAFGRFSTGAFPLHRGDRLLLSKNPTAPFPNRP